MSWVNSPSAKMTRSYRSASLTTTSGQNISSIQSSASLQASSVSTLSSTESIHSSSSETSSAKAQTVAVQKLYLLLPNHKCPNKKTCPFHPPEEQEEELEEAEITLVNKRRAMSLASHEMITEQLLAEKLAKINQQISSNLLEGNKLHFPRKTSHDITLPTADIERLRFEHYGSDTAPGAGSTREESVASDYDLDSGVTFDSCSDRDMDEDFLPLIQEEIIIPDIVITEKFRLKTEDAPEQDQQQSTDVQATVEVNEVTAVDSAEDAEASATITIEEHVPETHSKPRFVKELEYLTVTEGSLVRLECAVTGHPKPAIQWLKNDRIIDADGSYKTQISDDGAVSLIIDRARIDDTGSYKCVAENIAGSASTESKIRVQKAVEDRSSPIRYQQPAVKEVRQPALLAPPEFTTALKNRSAPEGVTVRLTCSAVGIPQPTLRWFKNDKEIFDDRDYTFNNHGGLSSLEVTYVKQSLAGKYTVEASNTEGTTSCSCVLEVEGEEKIEELELDFLRPKFIRKIEDVHVREGEDATFTCTATGKPMPVFKWQKDMINITASDQVEIESNSQGHSHLTLKKVKPSDNGLYYCVAQSKAGRAKCTAYLHVKAKSSSPAARQKENDEYFTVQARKESSVERGGMLGSPPSLQLLLPDSLDIVVGGRLKLDCSVHGYPMPLVTWHKGDRGLMYSQRHRIIACGTLYTMEIPQVMALDKGEYIVRATNVYGTVQSSCYVNILPGGSKFSLSDYERPAVITVTKEYLQAPYFVKHLPKSIDAVLGMHIRLDCLLNDRTELPDWSKSKSSIEDLEKVKKELVDEGFHGEFIPYEARPRELQSKDRKLADANKSRSSGQEEKTIERISFRTNLSNLDQQAGSDVVFECSTAGGPDPEIKWYKDGQLLTSSDRVKMVTADNKHTLRIEDVCSLDAGEYSCKASNVAGTKISAAFLTVSDVPERKSKAHVGEKEKKSSVENTLQDQPARQDTHEALETAEKPSFRELLPRNTSANQGDTVELVCQLTSSNVLSVKWELDGREIPKESKYIVSSDESSNQHKLVINSVRENDSGKYTCVGYLKDGDLVHTSTKLNVSAAKLEPEQKTEDLKPHFTSLLQDTMVRDGEGLILECDIEGNPRPQISWFRDGMEIQDSQDFQISTIGSHCKLQIHDIYPEDEGNYSCRAINNIGEVASSCYVSVEDLGEDMSADSASTASSKSFDKARARRGEATEADVKKTKKGPEKPEVPPELVVKPRRQFVDESSNAKFKASFDGSPSTILFWSKDGQILSDNDHFKMYEADGFHFLEVQKVAAEDNGMYSVTVQNLAGADTAEAELEVFEKPKLLTRSGPEWEQSLQDLTVEEGDAGVELVCTCKELTQPSVRWFHNGKEVFSGFHMKFQHMAQTATLTIKEIHERDAGEFKCVMTGKNGELETSCNLIIKSEEQMEPPVFVKELHDMEVEEGDKLELDVEVKGTSPVNVCWYHNNEEITLNSPQYLITSVGHVHTLTQLNATAKFTGDYVCEAYNDNGSADTFCFIEVREVEHPEPPDFVIRPSNLSAHEGEMTIFTCQVKGQPMPSVLWKKDGSVIATNHKFKITRIRDRHTLKIHSLDHDDKGEYVCCLRNTEGETSHVFRLDLIEQKHSVKSQAASAMNTRSADHLEMQQMSQFSSQTLPHEQHLMTPSETTNGYKRPALLHTEDGIEDTPVLVTRTTPKTSHETTVGGNHLYQFPKIDNNTYSQPYHETDMSENTGLPHKFAVTPVQSAPYKVQQTRDETKDFSNSDLMNSRSSVIHTHNASLVQSGESTQWSYGTDLKRVMLTNNTHELSKTEFMDVNGKGQLHTSEPKYSPNVQISKNVHSREFTSDSHQSSSSLSSRLPYSASKKRDHNLVEDFTYPANDTAVGIDPSAVQHTIGATRDADVSSAYVDPPSQTVTQSWRRRTKGNSSPSSSYQNFTTGEGSTDSNKVQEEFNSSNLKTGNALFLSEVQVVDTKTRDRKHQASSSSSTEDFKMFLNLPSAANHSDHGSDNHHICVRNHSAAKSEKVILKHEPQKVNLLQLSACKVSVSEFNPSEPQSDALKLEVTSITASVPLRQSLSSARLNSQPHSETAPTHLLFDSSDRKQEDDDVFTNISKVKISTQESEQNNKESEAKHNLQTSGSAFKGNNASSNATSDKKSILSNNITSHTYDQENPTAKSRIRYSENIKSYRDNDHQENTRSTYRLSTVSRNEMSPGSNTAVPGSSVPSVGAGHVVDDFRSIKLKPTAAKGKDNSDLSKSKFMSKSTESIFTDVKLKPVLKAEDSWKRSEISSNADRIRNSSKSIDFSKLVPTSSYQSTSRNKPAPRTTTSATSTASKFTDSLKVFSGDDKSKHFHQNSKYPKSAQGSKIRASTGKYERVSSGGVTRSNSHRKSKGIGAKFETAIKDIKSTQQVPYASLHFTKNKSVVKPSVQPTPTEYTSKRVSDHQQHHKTAEATSAEKGCTQAADNKSPAISVLDNGGDNYRDNISDWVKRRQSLHVDVPNILPSDNNTLTENKTQSTIAVEKSQQSRRNLETNELNKINTVIVNNIQDEDCIKADLKRQSEVRMRTRSGARNLEGSSDANWVGPQASQDRVHAKHRQDNARISHPTTEYRISHTDQQATTRLHDSTTAVDSTRKSVKGNFVESLPQPFFKQSALLSKEPVTVNNGNRPVTRNLASSDERTTETYKSHIVIIPKTAVSTKPSSTIVTLPTAAKPTKETLPAKQSAEPAAALTNAVESVTNTIIPQVSFTSVSPTTETKAPSVPGKIFEPTDNKLQRPQEENTSFVTSEKSDLKGHSEATPVEEFGANESPPRERYKESHLDNQESSLRNSKTSWTKQKSMRQIPLYPVNENELSPHSEVDISSMTDLDSGFFTSISSSSSDVSNVTSDSGYIRNNSHRLTGSDKIHPVNDTLHPLSWNRQAGSDNLNEVLKYQTDNDHEIKHDLWETMEDSDYAHKPSSYNRNTNNGHLSMEQKYVQSQRIKQGAVDEAATVSAISNSSKQTEQDEEYTKVYSYKLARGDTKQTGHQLRNVSEESAIKSTSVPKESESLAGMKEDFASDSILINEYIPRRQRRQHENYVATTSSSTAKMENSEISKGRSSYANAPDIVTTNEFFPQKQMPVSYKNSNTMDNVNEVRVERGQTTNSRMSMSDQSSSKTLRQQWRSSRQQNTEISSDKDMMPSIDINQGVETLPKSNTGVISTPPSAPLLTTTTTSGFPSAPLFTTTTTSGYPSAPLLTTTTTSGYPSAPLLTTTTASRYPSSPASLSGPLCPPSFPVPLRDTSVMYGSPAVLRCQVIGNPRPDVKWLLNQIPVEPSDKIEIAYSDITAQLTITETSTEHQGDFTCWARNSQGTVSSHCALRLNDDLIQNVGGRTVQAVTGSDTCEMSDTLSNSNDTENTTTHVHIGTPVGRPCVSVKNSSSVSLSWPGSTSREESDVIYYIIEGKETEEKVWDIFIPKCKLFPCLIEGLKPSTSYQFRVLAASRHGVSPPSEPSETVMTLDSVTLTNDGECEGQLPFKPREVVVNTRDHFEDLYEKLKEVGKGKFGVVYRCKHKTDGSIWAAKVVRCREKEKVSLKREIDIMNKLHHPKLLLLWDAFESPRQMVLVMEYVGAGELFERVIGDDYVLTENDCIHFVRQICEGVAYMHSNSILHLDLKPENILCVAENSNRIKIIDFGLAQFYTPGKGTKVLFGTPDFIAPEVINYDEISFGTDMWSLGVICYVLLSGLSPFLGDNDAETLASVTIGEYDFDDDAFDEISDEAKDFISNLLVKKKEKRMLTAQCLAHPWLSQDEVDGIHGRRLNTERLKKFMIRRKWLKTGNAVKAVSRLLKSNSLTGFGVNIQSSSNMPGTTPTNISAPESILVKTEVSDDDDNVQDSQSELTSIESDIAAETSQHLHSVEDSFNSIKENGSSAKVERTFIKADVSHENQGGNEASSDTVTNSVEKNNAEFVSQVIPRRLRESTSKADETNSWIASRSPQYVSERVKDVNQGFVKTAAYSASSVPRESNNSPSSPSLTAVEKKSFELPSSSAQGNRISLHNSNRKTEVTHISGVGDEGTLPQAPRFTKTMARCKTYVGDVARFDVTVLGHPLPHVTWFFEDEEIISDTRHVMSSNANTRAFSLIIRNVEEDDEGEYTCKAVSSLGDSSCVAELVVLVL